MDEPKVYVNGSGYKYTTDENGKVISLARKLIEEELGVKLSPKFQVSYRDGDKSNCVLENLYVTLKAGVPLASLYCLECGSNKISLTDC